MKIKYKVHENENFNHTGVHNDADSILQLKLIKTDEHLSFLP